MKLLSSLPRVAVTLLAIALAVVVGRELWTYYVDAPWTRDGRVRADIVGVSPDVSGPVSEIMVADNQAVRQGDLLFRIDPARFEIALQQVEATVAARKASLDQAIREYDRYRQLTSLSVSIERQEQTFSTMQQATAAYQQALADRNLANLNLSRSEVRAPVNGTVTNLDLRPGDYVTAGKGVFALVDSDTIRVEGYFEETKLSRIHVGDKVSVHLMGTSTMLRGRVQSIASGIADRERSASGDLLANVNPTFSWVRLAQRVPVRIALEDVPPEMRLVVGRTAMVVVDEEGGRPKFPVLGRAGSP